MPTSVSDRTKAAAHEIGPHGNNCRYVNNNPVNLIDPTGLAEEKPSPSIEGKLGKRGENLKDEWLGRLKQAQKKDFAILMGSQKNSVIGVVEPFSNKPIPKNNVAALYLGLRNYLHSSGEQRLQVIIRQGAGLRTDYYPFERLISGDNKDDPNLNREVHSNIDRDSVQIAVRWRNKDKHLSRARNSNFGINNQNTKRRAANWQFSTLTDTDIGNLNYGKAFVDFKIPKDAQDVDIVAVYTDSLDENWNSKNPHEGDLPIIIAAWSGTSVNKEKSSWSYKIRSQDVIQYLGRFPNRTERASILKNTRDVLSRMKFTIEPRIVIDPETNRKDISHRNSGFDIR